MRRRLAGLASAMRLIKFDVGHEFDVITVSFDPRETPHGGRKKKDTCNATAVQMPPPAGISLPARPIRLTRSPRRSDFSTNTIPRRISMLTPPRSWCSPRRDTSRAICMAWIFRRKICGWGGRGLPGEDRQPRRRGAALLLSLQSCDGKYGAVIGNILRLAGGVTFLLVGGLILTLSRLDRRLGGRPNPRKRRFNNFHCGRKGPPARRIVWMRFSSSSVVTGMMALLVCAFVSTLLPATGIAKSITEQIEGSNTLELPGASFPSSSSW